MPNISKRMLVGVVLPIALWVSILAVVTGFVVFYASRPSNPFQVERVSDADYFIRTLGAEGGLFRYTGAQVECWLEQDIDGKITKGEPVSLATGRLSDPGRCQLKYGLLGLIRHPGEQKEVWELYHWAIWDRKYENVWCPETRSDSNPVATFQVPWPKGRFESYDVCGGHLEYLMHMEGYDEQKRHWSVTLRCGPLADSQ